MSYSGGGGSGSAGYGSGASSGGDQFIEKSPLQPTPVGAFRFNTDSSKLEYYDGNQWVSVTSDSPEAQTGGGRGLFGGGATPSDEVNTIDYINLTTTGNALNFGDLTYRTDFPAACASRTRGFWVGGTNPGVAGLAGMDTVTISSTGDATDFNDDIPHRGGGGFSDQTRGIFPSINGGTNVIEYITMAATGTAVEFGDAYVAAASAAGLSSPTRGIMGGGDAPAYTNVIQYLTISTLGNTADFGDLSQVKGYPVGASSATRGLFMTGFLSPASSNTNTIEYITIASLGNALDFGDAAVATRHAAGTSDCKRAVCTAGAPGYAGSISYVQIATTGNAVDYGDQYESRRGMAGCSNAHGGLG
tara:strand:+ start:233 stop:1312 length:1080 start_codon:yes stop_codon:yes gene_type:complete